MPYYEQETVKKIMQDIVDEIQEWANRNYSLYEGSKEYKDGFVKGLNLSTTFVRATIAKIDKE
jgi:hypothetical protein